MQQRAWGEKRGSKKWLWTLMVAILCVGAIGLFIRNNPEIFSTKIALLSPKTPPDHTPTEKNAMVAQPQQSKHLPIVTKPHARPQTATNSKVPPVSHTSHPSVISAQGSVAQTGLGIQKSPALHHDDAKTAVAQSPVAEPPFAIDEVDVTTPDPTVEDIVELSGIDCRILDREDVVVVLSLSLECLGVNQRNDILLKRDLLKIIVRKIVAGKTLSDMRPDALAEIFHRELGGIFQQGVLQGVVVTDIRMEKVIRS